MCELTAYILEGEKINDDTNTQTHFKKIKYVECVSRAQHTLQIWKRL